MTAARLPIAAVAACSRCIATVCALVLVSFASAPLAQAHAVPVSYIKVAVSDNELLARFRIDAEVLHGILFERSLPTDYATADVQRNERALLQYVDAMLPLESAGKNCIGGSAQGLGFSTAGVNPVVTFDRHYACASPLERLAIGSGFLQDSIEVNGVSLVLESRGTFRAYTLQEVVPGPLTISASTLERPPIAAAAPRLAEPLVVGSGLFAQFFKEGWTHILAGFDHLLFILALALAALRWRDLAVLLTTFTVAHSLTLILGALDWVSVPGWIVEPAIALSILYVCMENLFRSVPRHRVAMTFAFGLIHGLGFSSAVQALDLPTLQSAIAILAFNTGVEVGQLAVILPVFALLRVLPRVSPRAARTKPTIAPARGRTWAVANVALGATACVWLVERIAGNMSLAGF